MTIYTADDLYSELQPKIKEIIYKSHAIELDLTQVEEIDTAGVQILMLIKRDMDRAGCAMRVRELSGAVEEVFGLYRLRKSCFPEGVVA
ncbi:MAG: hypothetical protein FD130_557 [Halothiobacillaceae bacterium]|nr:MAG: hypothetical protein FD130_557 [Halothiobacillaceae bacterium]